MEYVIVIICSYLIGSFSPARLLGRRKGVDITKVNSKNPGTSNVAVSFGMKYAVIVGLTDILKGFIPVLIVRFAFKETDVLWFIAGISAIFGHIHPFYAPLKGGKGTATFGGMVLAISPLLSVLYGTIFFLILIRSKYIAIATLFVIVAYPLTYYFFYDFDIVSIILISVFSLLSFYKHTPNFINIYKGEEMGLDTIGKGVDKEV